MGDKTSKKRCLVCGASQHSSDAVVCSKCGSQLFSLNEKGEIEGFLCPSCGGPLKFSHKDDVGKLWFLCSNCGQFTTKPKRAPEAPVLLPHLNLIEDPNFAGKRVIVEAVVSSSSISYLVPAEVEAASEDDLGVETTEGKIAADDPINIQLIGVSEQIKYKRLKRYLNLKRDAEVTESRFRIVYRIRVRPRVLTLERLSEKIVDEMGFEYKSFDVYVVSERPIEFQPSSLIRMEGIPLPHPRNQKTCLLAYRVEFPEEIQVYDVEKLAALKAKFAGKTIEERLNWLLDNFELYSGLVGRRNLAEATFLTFFTPAWIKFNGDIQRGGG